MTEELLKALQLIKEECKKYHHCDNCPILTIGGDCGVTEYAPKYWKLEKREVYF